MWERSIDLNKLASKNNGRTVECPLPALCYLPGITDGTFLKIGAIKLILSRTTITLGIGPYSHAMILTSTLLEDIWWGWIHSWARISLAGRAEDVGSVVKEEGIVSRNVYCFKPRLNISFVGCRFVPFYVLLFLHGLF